jgi:hypothetical protein
MSLPSPSKSLPKIQLSPRVRQKIIEIRKSPKKYKKSLKSPHKRTKAFVNYQRQFHSNPSVNPETNRKIKRSGKTYKRLVTVYGSP